MPHGKLVPFQSFGTFFGFDNTLWIIRGHSCETRNPNCGTTALTAASRTSAEVWLAVNLSKLFGSTTREEIGLLLLYLLYFYTSYTCTPSDLHERKRFEHFSSVRGPAFCPAQPTPWPKEAATSSVFERPGTAGNCRFCKDQRLSSVQLETISTRVNCRQECSNTDLNGEALIWDVTFCVILAVLVQVIQAGYVRVVTSNVTSQRDMGREWGRN